MKARVLSIHLLGRKPFNLGGMSRLCQLQPLEGHFFPGQNVGQQIAHRPMVDDGNVRQLFLAEPLQSREQRLAAVLQPGLYLRLGHDPLTPVFPGDAASPHVAAGLFRQRRMRIRRKPCQGRPEGM